MSWTRQPEVSIDNGSSEWNWYLLIFWNTFPLTHRQVPTRTKPAQ